MDEPAFEIIEACGDAKARGRAIASGFGERVTAYHKREIVGYFERQGVPYARQRAFAEACEPHILSALPGLAEELTGSGEVCGLDTTDLVLALCHEELFGLAHHKQSHCICFVVSTGESGDGTCYAGQTWDWMRSMYGQSALVRWQNESGRRILFYGYPAIPYGAGMNDRGLGLVWMSGGLWCEGVEPVAGLPAYALLYGLLQHATVEEALAWAYAQTHAGWFNILLCDSAGRVACLEGAPGVLDDTRSGGVLARHWYYHTPKVRAATSQDAGGPLPPVWFREARMAQLLNSAKGRMDPAFFQAMLCENEKDCAICYGPGDPNVGDASMSVDLLFFAPNRGEAWFARGPLYETPGAFERLTL